MKLKGPLSSLKASGTVADVLTFSTSKKGAYAKTHRKPANPKTGLQVGSRAMVGFLAKEWRNLTAVQMATWFETAITEKVANYHVYIAANTRDWRHNLPPSKIYPRPEATAPYGKPWVFAGAKQSAIKIQTNIWGAGNLWGYLIFRGTTSGFTSNREHAIAAVHRAPSTNTIYWDTPLEPGTYYYRTRPFSYDGVWSLLSNRVNATVT